MKRYLRERFRGSAQYKLPLYPLFMELGLRLTRRGGLSSFVVPDSFLSGSRFDAIRETLLGQTHIEEIAVFEEGIWPGGTSGRTIAYRARNLEPSADASVTLRRIDDLDAPAAAARTTTRRQRDLAQGPYDRFEIVVEDSRRALVERMRGAEGRLGSYVDFYSGCIARYGQDSIRSTERCEHWRIRDRSGEPVVEDDAAADHWRRLVPSGRHLTAFELYRPASWLYFHPDRSVRRAYAKSGFDASRYEAPKLFLRQTGHTLVAAFDDRGAFCLNNIHVVNAPDREHLHLVAALLNSRALRTYHRIVSLEGDRSLAQIDIDAMRELPVPAPSSTDADRLCECAERCTVLGERLADADRSYDAELDAPETGVDSLALAALADRLPSCSLEPLCDPKLEGRLTGLTFEMEAGTPTLRGEVDGERLPLVAVDATSNTETALALLALREMFRRHRRRRVWAKGEVFEALVRTLELRLPAGSDGADPSLVDAAARFRDTKRQLDRRVCELYGVAPEAIERARKPRKR